MRCYNTSGGFLSSPLDDVLASVEQSIASGIGGIKIKVGHPDPKVDITRIEVVARQIDGRAALMVGANQQWDRATAPVLRLRWNCTCICQQPIPTAQPTRRSDVEAASVNCPCELDPDTRETYPNCKIADSGEEL
jgi:L-alanine-DL-glutamate epimerase-like enolase superfamily enzyme